VSPASWRPVWSPAAARRAARAMVVMPGMFALTLEGFGNLQMALFAGFGSFATLVLAAFSGTRKDKLRAHLGLALAGSVLLVIGTAVSPAIAVAALATVPVTFIVFFAGVTGPNAANGVTAALLVYVLPAASPGTLGMVPDRLAGWWLASVAGTIVVFALPTPSAGNKLRVAVTELSGRLADALEVAVRGEDSQASLAAATTAKRELLATFSATPFRPTGLAIRDQALASAVELLEWCTAIVTDTLSEQLDLVDTPARERDLLAASANVLCDSGRMLADRSLRPDLASLDAQLEESRSLTRSGWTGRVRSEEAVRVAFHAQAIATNALAVGADALLAAELADPDQVASARESWLGGDPGRRAAPRSAISRYFSVAVQNASVRSVWFVNSLRGAGALAVAVAVADASSVQHGFWVVLGTLSVLRTNASATGATAVRAIVGTAIGFVIGGALLVGIGASSAALWAVLPVVVLIAAYAPGTAPFAVGQAAFTITVVILFNLLVPVGWKVGELRVEDVAIGCLVSVVVGALAWPRGLAPLMASDLADAYRTGAAYLREALAWVLGQQRETPAGGAAALTAAERLDQAVRSFLAEQGTKRLKREELWRLIGGTLRLRLTAHSIAGLPRACAGADPESLRLVRERGDAIVDWYEQLALHLSRTRVELPPLAKPDLDGGRAANASADAPGSSSREAIWLSEHLDHLADNLAALVPPATHLAEIRREPWWR
jgi:uncharacterized membrane protein YccC